MRIWLLGGFRVSVGSRIVEGNAWRLRKAAALLKLLSLAPGHHMHREQIMDLLWSDQGLKAASNNLRQAVHVARKTLHPDAFFASRYLDSRDEQLLLCPQEQLWVDVEAFEKAGAAARRAQDPAAYKAALELYAGDLLPEDRYEGWAENRREQLRGLYLALLIGLAGLYEGRGDLEPAIEALQRVIAEEPTNEEAHVGLMRLHALSGRRGLAVAQYGRLHESLSAQLGTEPSAATRHLRDEIATDEYPPARSLLAGSSPEGSGDVHKHNLPVSRTSFVGRERELMEVKRELAMTSLLTLTGTGGTGKTRLALQVARDLTGIYPDGVWLVELAPLSEPKLVPKATAEALGVPERSGQPLTATLVDALRSKTLLLVLDNCEHLVDAVAQLVDALLDACPQLQILATSREPLKVAGEMTRPVSPLAVPAPQRELTVSELVGIESVRLFMDRARYRNSSFALTPENAQAVADVCGRLDGIPLAIELAAARAGALSVKQIAERLEDSLELLSSGSRTASERHRTLRGALSWSHDLLGESERTLFRRLSVFAGGWTLESAEAVGAGGNVVKVDVMDLVSRLVDKSLVVCRAGEEGEMRYGMLDPVRQYAREKLEESGEAAAVRRRHAEFFLALVEEEPEAFKGLQPPEWTRRLEEEHDNLRAALAWSLESDEAELGLRLAGASHPFWSKQGNYSEGRRWLEAALTMDAGVPTQARTNALAGVGWLALWQGDLDRASAAAEEGLRLSPRAGREGSVTIHLLLLLGFTAARRADYERATDLFEESLNLSREAGDEWGMAASLLHFGNVAGVQGDHERSTEFYEEGLALCRKSGYATVLADTLTNLGHELLLQGDHERAAALNEEAVALYRERGYRNARLEFPLDHLGWAALLGGDYERSKTLHEESLRLCQELGDKLVAAECLDGLACAAGARGEIERAAKMFGAAQALHEAVGYHQPPEELALREPYLLATRSRLGEASWEAAFSEGQRMTFEEAVEYALYEEELAASSSATSGRPRHALTRREEELAILVAGGLTNRQIATELSISEHTVATHVARIRKKLGLQSRSQIGYWLTQQGLASADLS
jgi:predicted ATPase/DNA-binding SARP family transcriptional activator/DNA-binding CsgD family transcriptional regulator